MDMALEVTADAVPPVVVTLTSQIPEETLKSQHHTPMNVFATVLICYRDWGDLFAEL